jgi:hypothetical protein
LKPFASIRTLYVPGIKPAELYRPVSLVVARDVCPVGPVIVTLALGTTAPEESVTTPAIPPVETVVWANAADKQKTTKLVRTQHTINRTLAISFMRISPEEARYRARLYGLVQSAHAVYDST